MAGRQEARDRSANPRLLLRSGCALRIEGGMLLNFARFADKEEHRGPLTCDLAPLGGSQRVASIQHTQRQCIGSA